MHYIMVFYFHNEIYLKVTAICSSGVMVSKTANLSVSIIFC
jgi:hypothetical protein